MEQYQTVIRIIEEGHRREKRNLLKQLNEVKTDMQALKMTTSKLRKSNEERMRIELNLRKELEAVKKSWEDEMNGIMSGVKKHREELRFYRREKRHLKKELEGLKWTVWIDWVDLFEDTKATTGS